MKVLRFLYDNLREKRRMFWVVFAFAILDGVFVNLMALSFGRISSTNLPENEEAIILSIVFLIGSLLTSYVIRRFGETLALVTAESVRSRMIARLVNVPLLTLQKRHSGYVLSLVNRVADTLQPVVFNLYWWAARSLVFFIVLCFIVMRQSVTVLVVDIAILLIFVLLSQWLSSLILHFNKSVNHAKSNFMSVFADFASNISTVKRLHLATYMKAAIAHEKEKVEWSVNRQQEFHAVRWLMLHGVFALLFTVTFTLLLWQLNRGLLTVGSFVVLIWFFWGLRGDLNSLAENLKVYTELGGYIDQIEAVFEDKENYQMKAQFKPGDVCIEMKRVSFTYPHTKTTITVPELTVKKGDIVAIRGPSGQGKSTLLHIMAGLIEAQKGTIARGFHEHDTAIISQEVELFNTTLRENMLLGNTVSEKRLFSLMEELDLIKIIEAHSEGLDVIIGEKGLRLSTGQKQRVNILRAFIQDKSVIFLDEPIAHLDPRTATKAVSFLKRHLKGKTAFIVSHQPQILELATKKYEMKRRILKPLNANN